MRKLEQTLSSVFPTMPILKNCIPHIAYSALKKDFKKTMTEFLQNYIEEHERRDSDERIEFLASLTPLHSNTQFLLTRHRHRVKPVEHILEQDFTKHSLQLVLGPDR